MSIKELIMNQIHNKNLSSYSKGNQLNEKATEWEKIFADHVSHKGSISKIYEEHI